MQKLEARTMLNQRYRPLVQEARGEEEVAKPGDFPFFTFPFPSFLHYRLRNNPAHSTHHPNSTHHTPLKDILAWAIFSKAKRSATKQCTRHITHTPDNLYTTVPCIPQDKTFLCAVLCLGINMPWNTIILLSLFCSLIFMNSSNIPNQVVCLRKIWNTQTAEIDSSM